MRAFCKVLCATAMVLETGCICAVQPKLMQPVAADESNEQQREVGSDLCSVHVLYMGKTGLAPPL